MSINKKVTKANMGRVRLYKKIPFLVQKRLLGEFFGDISKEINCSQKILVTKQKNVFEKNPTSISISVLKKHLPEKYFVRKTKLFH